MTTSYEKWRYGPSSSPDYFPIAVWLQDPNNAKRYQAAGINLYVALWSGPTEAQLKTLRDANMPVVCEQNTVGLAHKNDPIIVGWMHGDEPDNAQPVTNPAGGGKSYGPPVPPHKIVSDYQKLRSTDPNRPVLLNLGQGVAYDGWIGRGPDAKLSDYETYVKGSDIVSFDVYPVAGLPMPDSENYLWYVAQGVERLMRWTDNKKPVWNCIECTRIDAGKKKATPHQVRAEVWMALIHGSRGLIYFVHEFKPKFNEHALLDDKEMLAAVTGINRQVQSLAPVLSSPTLQGQTSVTSSDTTVPIATVTKSYGGATYVFTVGMRNGPTKGIFTVRGLPKSITAEVLGENRMIKVTNGSFEDGFAPYDVHLYRIK